MTSSQQSQQLLFTVMLDAACALAESLRDPLALSFHGAAAGDAVRAWAAARGLKLRRDEIRPERAAPWTRLVVLMGALGASCIEVHLDHLD